MGGNGGRGGRGDRDGLGKGVAGRGWAGLMGEHLCRVEVLVRGGSGGSRPDLLID